MFRERNEDRSSAIKRVFLSYNLNDIDLALKVISDLKDNNIIAINEQVILNAGEPYNEFIERALDQIDLMIVIVSSNIFRSDCVRNEIESAKKKKKGIISLLTDDVELPVFLTLSKPVDFRRDYHSSMKKLIDAM